MKILILSLKNDTGAMMIIMSLMILALMTIISVAAIRNAKIEVLISANDYRYQNNFYCAEGAVIEAVDMLEGMKTVEVDKIGWLMNETPDVDKDHKLFGYWINNNRRADDARPRQASVCAEHSELMTVHVGVVAGNSLDMSKPTKHLYSVYGYSRHRGSVMITVGYTKVF